LGVMAKDRIVFGVFVRRFRLGGSGVGVVGVVRG
jgi:hypothetical protein